MNIPNHFMFYTEDTPKNDTITLDIKETHHAVHVLRIQDSDPLCITNGEGTVFSCICTGFHEKKLIADIQERHSIHRTASIHLLIGLPERDAFELLISECTALGVSSITPLIAAHCQRSWWKSSWKKLYDRFKNKMIVSMKQALYPFLPLLHEPISLTKSMQAIHSTILLAESDGKYLNTLKNDTDLKNVACFIGPPGGFSTNEVDYIMQQGGKKVKIAESRLRTELASTSLCAQLNAMYY